MSWMKKQLTTKEFSIGLQWEIQEYFADMYHMYGRPRELAMFVDREDPSCLYFVPAENLIIQAIQESYGLEHCSEPRGLDIRTVVGSYDEILNN